VSQHLSFGVIREGSWGKLWSPTDNVGKGHLAAGADSNLRRLTGIVTSKAVERDLVWRMSQYER
jgi:hypothetical protein